jgi:hypothetical protein
MLGERKGGVKFVSKDSVGVRWVDRGYGGVRAADKGVLVLEAGSWVRPQWHDFAYTQLYVYCMLAAYSAHIQEYCRQASRLERKTHCKRVASRLASYMSREGGYDFDSDILLVHVLVARLTYFTQAIVIVKLEDNVCNNLPQRIARFLFYTIIVVGELYEVGVICENPDANPKCGVDLGNDFRKACHTRE